MMEIIIILFILTIGVGIACSIACRNLLRKLESAEEYIEDLEKSNIRYEQFFQELKRISMSSYSEIRQIDRIGSFESDDETGIIFKNIKDIVIKLNEQFNDAQETVN
jgi:hypothetical protein